MVAAPTIRQSVRGARSMTSLLHRDVVAVGVAEPGPAVLVAGDEVLHEVAELDVERLVEVQPLADQLELLRRRRLAGEAQRRVAVRQLEEDEERDEHDDDHDERPSRRGAVTM